MSLPLTSVQHGNICHMVSAMFPSFLPICKNVRLLSRLFSLTYMVYQISRSFIPDILGLSRENPAINASTFYITWLEMFQTAFISFLQLLDSYCLGLNFGHIIHCLTLGKLLNLSLAQFSYLQKDENYNGSLLLGWA